MTEESTTIGSNVCAEPLPLNYQWWQKNGAVWVERYESVKRDGPKYHVSEFIICEYAANSAPSRVLEFGCGSGRHLRYLSRMAGVDVHGYDQSPTMIEGIRRWAPPGWMEEHVKLGPPLGRLPYDDAQFDFVFTASVLVHVRPEDLLGVLRELLRVSGGHVLHLEARYGIRPPHRADSDGCWSHNLEDAYRQLGYVCEDLSPGCNYATLYRTLGDKSKASHTPSPVLLSLYDQMVKDLTPVKA